VSDAPPPLIDDPCVEDVLEFAFARMEKLRVEAVGWVEGCKEELQAAEDTLRGATRHVETLRQMLADPYAHEPVEEVAGPRFKAAVEEAALPLAKEMLTEVIAKTKASMPHIFPEEAQPPNAPKAKPSVALAPKKPSVLDAAGPKIMEALPALWAQGPVFVSGLMKAIPDLPMHRVYRALELLELDGKIVRAKFGEKNAMAILPPGAERPPERLSDNQQAAFDLLKELADETGRVTGCSLQFLAKKIGLSQPASMIFVTDALVKKDRIRVLERGDTHAPNVYQVIGWKRPASLPVATALEPPLPPEVLEQLSAKGRAEHTRSAEIAPQRGNGVSSVLERAIGDAAARLAPASDRSIVVGPKNGRHWITRERFECAFPVGGSGADLISCCEPAVPPKEGASAYCDLHTRVMWARLAKADAAMVAP
jgi:hypothetical protein